MTYEVKTFCVIDYNELEQLVKEVFNPEAPYEFVAAEVANNYSSYTFDVPQTLREYDRIEFADLREKFEEKDFNSIPAWAILHALALLGKIPFGNWLVTVSW